MPRLPISSKAPPSPSDANDAAMKSSERLLSTACNRPACTNRVAPIVKAAPSRELHRRAGTRSTQMGMLVRPPRRAHEQCLQPLRVLDRLEPHAARRRLYDRHAARTQPGALDGRVRRAPRDGQRARLLKRQRWRLAGEEGHGCDRHRREGRVSQAQRSECELNGASRTMPAASPPGGPGSPGYSPSTLSTSRKLRPTARTRKSTSASRREAMAGCGSRKRLLMAPRAWKCSRTRPSEDGGAVVRRGRRRLALAQHRLGLAERRAE